MELKYLLTKSTAIAISYISERRIDCMDYCGPLCNNQASNGCLRHMVLFCSCKLQHIYSTGGWVVLLGLPFISERTSNTSWDGFSFRASQKKSILAEIAPFVGCGIRMKGALWVQGEVGHLEGIKTCNINAGSLYKMHKTHPGFSQPSQAWIIRLHTSRLLSFSQSWFFRQFSTMNWSKSFEGRPIETAH